MEEDKWDCNESENTLNPSIRSHLFALILAQIQAERKFQVGAYFSSTPYVA